VGASPTGAGKKKSEIRQGGREKGGVGLRNSVRVKKKRKHRKGGHETGGARGGATKVKKGGYGSKSPRGGRKNYIKKRDNGKWGKREMMGAAL